MAETHMHAKGEMPFASGYVHPFDLPAHKTLRQVIEDSEKESARQKLNQQYRQSRTAAVEAIEARRYPEQELRPLPPVPVTIDENGQLGWILERGWRHQ